MKNKKKILIVVIPVIILIGLSAFLSIFCYKETKRTLKYFSGESETALLSVVASQTAINKRLEKISNNNSYNLENAYIELNPYQISPLSAIIIFSTSAKESVDVYINDVFFTHMDATTKHIIPIYGLYEDYENKIKLVIKDKYQEYTIKTKPSNIKYPLEVEEKKENLKDDELYFTVASYETWLTGWDTNGKLRFYLTEDMRMDVEWLDNGHFIIGTTQGQYAENFLGFVEMDYLGKIYNYYTLENGFSFESQVLSNGNIMSAGGSTPVYITEQVIYEMNPSTGNKVDEINLYTLFKNIDAAFDDKYLGQAAVRNGFYYNEETRDLLISFRGIDTVFCVDFKKKELKWIFTSPDNEVFKNSLWDEYKVVSDDNNYPWGQHSPQITAYGLIAFFNNGYKRYNGFEVGGPDNLSYYKNNYSRAEAYEIKDKKAKLVWVYDANKKLFSHQYGSIHIDENNHKLINFGYVLKDDYRSLSTSTLSLSEQSPEHIYSEIIELDEDDEVLFKAKCEEGKYRVFKHSLYKDNTANIELARLNIFNSLKADELKEVTTDTLSLEDSRDWLNSLEFTKNTFKTDYDIKEDDEVNLYFVNKGGKTSILTYKEKNSKQINRIFDVELNGQYALYININNQVYKTGKIIQF